MLLYVQGDRTTDRLETRCPGHPPRSSHKVQGFIELFELLSSESCHFVRCCFRPTETVRTVAINGTIRDGEPRTLTASSSTQLLSSCLNRPFVVSQADTAEGVSLAMVWPASEDKGRSIHYCIPSSFVVLYIHRNCLWLIRVGIIYQPALQYVSVMECGKLYIYTVHARSRVWAGSIPSYHAGMCTVISNSIPKSWGNSNSIN